MVLQMKQLWRNQQGSAVFLVSIALLALLAITGLVIDGGTLYVTKTHLQKTANAAALSGAQELTNSETDVRAVVDHVVAAHGEQGSLAGADIQADTKVTVRLRKEVQLYFVGLFWKDRAPVEASASAEIQTMSAAMGAAPLGIDESISLEFNREYKLKVDETEVSSGNFGVLALGGPGAATYEDNLRNGYSSELNVGDIIDTQTGNIAGKTRSGVQERIDQCPYPEGDTTHRDCPRVILIPVYRPYYYDSNQIKEVEITGFAYFYITKPMDSKDTAITGMFIERAGTGFVDPDTANKGAFGIRLTE